MWSGPRNISTAMLRSWGNRPDTFVCDEPLYAHYMRETDVDHPGRDEILAAHDSDWRSVVAWLTGDIPDGKSIFYQKHMAHHLLSQIDRDWVFHLRNAFLIRDPREMLTSLIRVMPQPRVEDTGLPQQWELFERLAERGGAAPPVIDARDVLEAPESLLSKLCAALEVPFDRSMLAWEAGPRATDGVWAKHWYASVEASTGFQPYRPKPDPLPDGLRDVYQECVHYYEKLHRNRLTA